MTEVAQCAECRKKDCILLYDKRGVPRCEECTKKEKEWRDWLSELEEAPMYIRTRVMQATADWVMSQERQATKRYNNERKKKESFFKGLQVTRGR